MQYAGPMSFHEEDCMKLKEKLRSRTWIAKVASLLAGLIYLAQSIFDAHFLDVTMDEGTYLVKGLLYTTGVYRPFQFFGPWTNKTPLAFTIPGFVQSLFEPGLRTGRYFAIFLSLLLLLGLWLITYRLRGHWWAAAVVVIMALNPGNITIYSRALSQGLVACMLVWVLVLILSPRRRLWQTTLGATLATLIVLTRQNMLPVPLVVVLFIFWAYGRRFGYFALAAAGLVFVGYHALYWPNILTIWQPYLPGFAETIVNQILSRAGWESTPSTSDWSLSYGLLAKAFVFFEGLRMNFFASIGVLASWLFWPRRASWKTALEYQSSVFLSVLLIVLSAVHILASFFMDYCLYCYNGYLAFFMPAALLLVALSAPYWNKKAHGLLHTLALLVMVISCLGIGYGSYQVLDDSILNFPVPRMRNMQFLPGTVALWNFLFNKFGWSYEALQQALPALAGLASGVLLVLVGSLLHRFLGRKHTLPPCGYSVLIGFLVLGTLLSPTRILGGGKYADYCDRDVIASHEAVGRHLQTLIPPGSLVYWQNDVSPLPLLYLEGRQFFPPQLNHWYSYRVGGNPEILYKNGFWNAELADRWIQQADYLLIADRYVNDFEERPGFSEMTDELKPTGRTVGCRDKSIIHVYKRLK